MGICCPQNQTLYSQTIHQQTLNLNEFDKNTNGDNNSSSSYVSYSTFNQHFSSVTISLKTIKEGPILRKIKKKNKQFHKQ